MVNAAKYRKIRESEKESLDRQWDNLFKRFEAFPEERKDLLLSITVLMDRLNRLEWERMMEGNNASTQRTPPIQ